MNLQEAITEIEKRLAKAKEHLAVSYVEKQVSDWRGRVEVLTEVLGLLKQVTTTYEVKTVMGEGTMFIPKIEGMKIENMSIVTNDDPGRTGEITKVDAVPKRSRPVRTRGQ